MSFKNIKNKNKTNKLYRNLSQLNEAAKAVAYAKNSSDAEYYTLKHLRPQIELAETALNNVHQIFKK